MKSGIYQILNNITLDCYIGSSSDINKRKRTHFRVLKKGTHHSHFLQKAWDFYSEKAFSFIILEEGSDFDLLSIEQKYLDNFKPKYNVSVNATSPMKGRKHSEKTIQLFKNRKGRAGPDNHRFGTKWSPELREKILDARKGYKHTEETKRKMSETSKRINRFESIKPWIEKGKKKIIDSEGNIFESLMAASLFWKISIATVCDILKGRHSKTRKGISFNYV